MVNRCGKEIHQSAVHGANEMTTCNILEPHILGVLFPAFFATVPDDGLDFVFLLVLGIWVDIVALLLVGGLVLFKVLDIIDIVGDLCAPAGDADLA